MPVGTPPSPWFVQVASSIYHGCSGSARFVCFDQATIPRVWISERIFRKTSNSTSVYTEEDFRERKAPTENSNIVLVCILVVLEFDFAELVDSENVDK